MPWRLKDLVPEALKKAGGQAKLKRGLVLAAWKEVVGQELARLTEAVGLEEGTLTVLVADPVTAHQLTYSRLLLLRRYEERFPGVVKEIRFVVGPLRKDPPPKPPEEPGLADLEAARRALRLSQEAPPELREKVARAALAMFRQAKGKPCPICETPSEVHPCPTCRRHLQSPLVRKEAERLRRGKPPRLEGELLLVARHLARERLLEEIRDLYPEALREPSLRPLLGDLARRFRELFPEEPLPEGVRSLVAKDP
jgi:predicted nucleic acid-binding Zn ribbon protein